MREQIFRQGTDWHVRFKSQLINLNSRQSGELLLGLLEQVRAQETRIHKKGKKQKGEEDYGDERS